jgi:hypothetical protein
VEHQARQGPQARFSGSIREALVPISPSSASLGVLLTTQSCPLAELLERYFRERCRRSGAKHLKDEAIANKAFRYIKTVDDLLILDDLSTFRGSQCATLEWP